MAYLDDAGLLPVAFGALIARLGDKLTVHRDGATVRWSYDGLCATIEFVGEGRLQAAFIERPSLDRVSRALVAPLYRRDGLDYSLNAEGCTRMATDLADFFLGTREPRFTFAGTRFL